MPGSAQAMLWRTHSETVDRELHQMKGTGLRSVHAFSAFGASAALGGSFAVAAHAAVASMVKMRGARSNT